MTAPLFDVKAKFSNYVTQAENGEVIEITKHGKTSAVIIGINEYNSLKKTFQPSFIEYLKKWKNQTGGLNDKEYSELEKNLARNVEVYKPKGDLF